MMRRYMVGSLETDDVGLKSSQSLRNSEQTSSQMENSQCSSFDLFSQMMSQQQGYNSQPSEASQVAQKYYTKFTSKPSLFRNTGGKEVTALSDKPGLTRQRSFQDLQEFQKQKIRDKEERDLICTLISLLKESTDEIKSVVEKLQTDVQTQISSASVKTEEALRKTSQCFQDYTKDIFQEVINKLTVYQTTSQMENKLQEKEAVVETLRSELENARATRYDEIKQILQKTSSEHHKANIEEVNKILDDSCNSWKLDQQHFLDEFCNTAATKLEEKLEDGFRKVAQEWNKDLVQIAQVAGASTSESQNISVSRGQVSPYHLSRGHAGSRLSNSKPHQYLPPAIPIPHHNAPLTAVHGTAASNQASLKPTMPSVPSRDGRVLQSTLNLMTQEVYVNGQTRSKCHFTSNQNHNALPEQRTEFGSPSLSQQSVTQPTLRTPFARWGSKGPSPVATVAPLVKETIQQVIPRGGQSSVAPSKQDIRRKGKRNNYLPPQRRSARLKERKVGGKQYPAAACYSQERKSQTQKRDAYSHGYMTKMKRKSQSQLNFEMARSSQRRAVQKDFYGLNNDEQVIQVPRRPMEMTGYVHFGENHNTSCHEPVFGAPVVTYNRSGKRSGNQMKEVFQTVPQFVSNYGSDSDNSSTEGTFLSAQHQGVSSSQDLFIDAIEDQQINTSDEEEEEFSPCFLRNVKDNHCTDARVTNEVTRAVKKKRTLWGPATPQKRDLITFLTGAIGRKRHVV